jgi:hypothetical protein
LARRPRAPAAPPPQEDILLGEPEKSAGILRHQWVHLGARARYRTGRVRLVTIRKESGTQMRLITNIPPAEMSSTEIQTLYRRRWQVECFFRWLKCLLGCRHWLAQSQSGVTIQLYLAVIGGLLLQLVLGGRRPDRRLYERMQLYLLGWASAEELIAGVQEAQARALPKI